MSSSGSEETRTGLPLHNSVEGVDSLCPILTKETSITIVTVFFSKKFPKKFYKPTNFKNSVRMSVRVFFRQAYPQVDSWGLHDYVENLKHNYNFYYFYDKQPSNKNIYLKEKRPTNKVERFDVG